MTLLSHRQDRADPALQVRLDRGELRNARRTEEGYWVGDGYLARPGVLVYRTADGSERRELVPYETLRKWVESGTIARKPVTLEHPPEEVGPGNQSRYTIGDTSSAVEIETEEDGGYVIVRDLAIRREDGLAALERGVADLSPRYLVRLDPTPGTHPEFGDYDAIQAERVGCNHVALTESARGGPAIRLRADSAAAIEFRSDGADAPGSNTMNPILLQLAALLGLADVRADSSDEAAGPRVVEAVRKLMARADSAEGERDGAKAQLDAIAKALDITGEDLAKAVTEHVKALTERADAAEEALQAAAEAGEREKLAAIAKRLGVDIEDGGDVASMKRAIVRSKMPDLKEDASDDYVDGVLAAMAPAGGEGSGDGEGRADSDPWASWVAPASGTGKRDDKRDDPFHDPALEWRNAAFKRS